MEVWKEMPKYSIILLEIKCEICIIQKQYIKIKSGGLENGRVKSFRSKNILL